MRSVLGIDVCKSSVVVTLVTARSECPTTDYRLQSYWVLEANRLGVDQLKALALDADLAVLEPTGINYSRLWGAVLQESGIEIRLVDHKRLKKYREHLGLENVKTDQTDAFALGLYGLEFYDSPRRFVQIREPEITQLRKCVLRLCHLNRCQSPIINRARQDLAWQFPEIALISSVRGNTDTPLLWGWLARVRESKRYDLMYAQTVGLGLTDSVRLHAARICDLQREEFTIEREIKAILADPKFDQYIAVFRSFGFGQRVQALILSQIYPIENYLGNDGNPVIDRGRDRSEKRFKMALGYGGAVHSSGDYSHTKGAGTGMLRVALWQWIFTAIEVKRRRSGIRLKLGAYFDNQKIGGTPIRLVRSRTAARGVVALYKGLLHGVERF